MGWKGTLRSVSAASKRAARESEKQTNAANRGHSKIDKNIDQIISKAASFETKLASDPIKTLGLRYDEHAGFTSQPFELSSELFNGSINLVQSSSSNDVSFSPRQFTTDNFSITPLDFLFTRWGAILAVKIENLDEDYRIKTPWFKKSDPHSSAIYLLNPETSSYYYPISAMLSGETLSGHPKIGLVAFELFREVPSTIQIHVSDVKLSSERGKKYSFDFQVTGPDIYNIISQSLSNPSITDEIQKSLSPEVEKLRNQIPGPGCMIFLAPIVVGMVTLGMYLCT